jgi:hypothetical protein
LTLPVSFALLIKSDAVLDIHNGPVMHPIDRAVERLRRSLAARLVLRLLVPLFALWLLLWGLATVLLRAGFAAAPPPLIACLAGLPVLLLVSFLRARRRFPDREAVRALLDRSGGHDGMLAAAGERDLGAWDARLKPIDPPRIHWRGGRSAALLAGATLFAALAYLLPDHWDADPRDAPLDVAPQLMRLAEQLAALKKLGLLDEGRTEALTRALEQVREQASGQKPGRALEALDRARAAAEGVAHAAAEKAVRRTAELSRTEALAEMLRRAGADLDPKRRAEAAAQLAQAVRGGDEAKPGATPADLAKLIEAARAGKRDQVRDMEQLRRAGLLNRDALRRLDEAGRSGAAPPAAADDRMEWTRETPRHAERFREVALPPAALAQRRKEARPAQGPPTPDDPGNRPVRSGALADARAGGGSATASPLLPRHRAAVERYFDRSETPASR